MPGTQLQIRGKAPIPPSCASSCGLLFELFSEIFEYTLYLFFVFCFFTFILFV